MKKQLIAALGAIILSGSLFAEAPKHSPAAPAPATAKLVPTKVVTPSYLPRTFERGVLMLEFSIDASGRPQRIQVISSPDPAVSERVVDVFRHWRFGPSTAAVATRFVLPLEIVLPEA